MGEPLGTVGLQHWSRAFSRRLLREPHCLAHSKPDAWGAQVQAYVLSPPIACPRASVSSLLVAVLSCCVTRLQWGCAEASLG